MGNDLDINKISAEVITDLAKTTAQALYKKVINYVTPLYNFLKNKITHKALSHV